MNQDLFSSFERMTKENREHFTDFSLKTLAQSIGLSIRRIKLSPYTKDFGYNSGVEDVKTIIAEISMYQNDSGLLSRLEMLPHYLFTTEADAFTALICEDLIVRLSIYPEGNGFFTPTWIRGIGNSFSLQPNGARMDWDKITNQLSKRTGIRSRKWLIPGMTFEDATATFDGNIKAVKQMIQLWFMSGVKQY